MGSSLSQWINRGAEFTWHKSFTSEWDQREGGYSFGVSTGKLLHLPKISWFAWIFWLVFCCVVWSHFAIVKMPQLRWSVLARKNKAAVSDELLPLLHDWSIYIPVFPKYLNSSSLSKQKFFYCYFGISSHEKIWINLWFLDSDYSFLLKLVRNLSVWSRINLNSLALQKNFRLLSKKKNEDFLGKTGV